MNLQKGLAVFYVECSRNASLIRWPEGRWEPHGCCGKSIYRQREEHVSHYLFIKNDFP